MDVRKVVAFHFKSFLIIFDKINIHLYVTCAVRMRKIDFYSFFQSAYPVFANLVV